VHGDCSHTSSRIRPTVFKRIDIGDLHVDDACAERGGGLDRGPHRTGYFEIHAVEVEVRRNADPQTFYIDAFRRHVTARDAPPSR